MTRRPSIRRLVAALLAAVLVALTACGGSSAGDGRGGGAVSGTLTVSAAASLTESFTEVGRRFEEAHPGTTVRFTFDASGTLADQIASGAPVDVFVSADEANMTEVVEAGKADGVPTVFAHNRLTIVTKPGNPDHVEGLADLPGVGVISLCGLDAPCGTFAAQALEKARVTLDEGSITRGQNVKATLRAVTDGDAAAAIVYRTDAATAGDDVATVAIPDADNVTAAYPAVAVRGAPNAAAAAAFVAYLSTPAAQQVLRQHAFIVP